jgi:hypothetical protein
MIWQAAEYRHIRNTLQADISFLKPGLYLIVAENGSSMKLIVN